MNKQLIHFFKEKIERENKHGSIIKKTEVKQLMAKFHVLAFAPYLLKTEHLTSAEIETLLERKIIQFQSLLEEILTKFTTTLRAEKLAQHFMDDLPEIVQNLFSDASQILKNDPAAQSMQEVVYCYPGIKAITCYRFAHYFYQENIHILPRLITEMSHEQTGIDIHPGAKIGKNFCIDHGTGIVIGQTAIIGENVTIYQGVTIGALSVNKNLQNKKRHPTIEDNCIIYSNATILGGQTIIGKNSIIGGNVWITKSVPENSRLFYQANALEIKEKNNDQPEELMYEI